MRVICIDAEGLQTNPPYIKLTEGDTYDVIGELEHQGHKFYWLFTTNEGCAEIRHYYQQWRFIPVSETDSETVETLEECQTECI